MVIIIGLERKVNMEYIIKIKVNENILKCETGYGIYKDESLITDKINSLRDEGIELIDMERSV